VPNFSFNFCNSYEPIKFTEVTIFHPHAKKSEKNPDMFKGGQFFLLHSIFCCFEHLFESQDDSF
jgi:hypothetical protein